MATKKKTIAKNDDVNVASSWTRIERCFASNHPGLALKLRPPASPSQIAAAEETLGVRFPEDFRASLLVHDGQEDEPTACDLHLRPTRQAVLVADRRSRTRLPAWDGARDGHCGPVTIARIGRNYE